MYICIHTYIHLPRLRARASTHIARLTAPASLCRRAAASALPTGGLAHICAGTCLLSSALAMGVRDGTFETSRNCTRQCCRRLSASDLSARSGTTRSPYTTTPTHARTHARTHTYIYLRAARQSDHTTCDASDAWWSLPSSAR